MAKLIVEEGGKRRAFRMGTGVLTVGSGAEARLRLSSTDVAEIHAELELGEAGLKLRPRPGVVPPKVNGQPSTGERVLAPGTRVELGSARLWLEPEAGEAAAPAAAPATPSVQAPQRSPDTAAARGPSRRRAPVERSRGVPSWLIVVGILGGTGLAFLIWFRMVKTPADTGIGVATNHLRAARQASEHGDFDAALAELAAIPAGSMTPEQTEEKQRLEQDVRERLAANDLDIENASGTKYLDTLLKKYEGLYLQGQPDKAKARLFLKRCRTFHERWPNHPDMDWVRRQEARFAGYVDMNAPPTWEDVSWEVHYLTEGNPRNYVAAFALIDELLTRVSGEDKKKAENLRAELVAGRPEYATDRLYQAKYEFEKKQDTPKAVWWLVNNVAYLGDEALANESARFLVKMPDLEGHLLAYKRDHPDHYAAVMKNPVVAAWADDVGFRP